MKTKKTFSQYSIAFVSKLADLVAHVLELPAGPLGMLKASTIYPTELQMTADAVGHEMGLAEEAAIAFLVTAEGFRAEQETGFLAKLMPGKEKESYRERVALARQVEHVMDAFKDSAAPNEFLTELGRRLLEKIGQPVSDASNAL